MTATFALDVYGTLIDPLGIATTLRSHVGDLAPAFAQAWREKQLEYTFRRALMRDYCDFPTCTRQALLFVDRRLRTGLEPEVLELLMLRYLELPAYPEVAGALRALRSAGHRLYAFSNGHPDDLVRLLDNAALRAELDGIVSVHPVSSFKPDPTVYRHFLGVTGADADGTWLVSGNPFDVIGAHAVGWRTAWVRRDAAVVFDPWDVEPTLTVTSLEALPAAVQLRSFPVED